MHDVNDVHGGVLVLVLLLFGPYIYLLTSKYKNNATFVNLKTGGVSG